MYVWARGSSDYNINPLQPNVYLEAGHFQANNGAVESSLRLHVDGSSSSCPRIFGSVECPLHFRTPAFQAVVRVPSAVVDLGTYSLRLDATRGLPFNELSGLADVTPYFTAINAGTSTAFLRVSRSAGDDAALCQFIGPTPLHLVQATHSALLDNDFPGTVF